MKKIMIVGAGILQTYVIKKARELGYYVIGVDANPKAFGLSYVNEYKLIDIIDENSCLNYAKECCIDGIITAATDYGVLTVSYVSSYLGLPGINYSSAKIIKNKYNVRQLLNKQKADDTPQYFEVSKVDDVKNIMSLIIYPVIVKPCDGSGSRGVVRVNNEKELLFAVENAIISSLTKKALVETFIEGQEYGVESFVLGDDIFILGIMKKRMTNPPYYAELGHSIPSDLSNNLEIKVKNVVNKTIKALNINYGAVNMDILISNDNKVCVVDIGARMGGNLIGSHIIPLSTGIDYMGNIIKSSVSDEVDFSFKHSQVVSTSILALSPGKIKRIPSLQSLSEQNEILDLVFNKKEGDVISFYKNNLDGCGYVVTTGKDASIASDIAFKYRYIIDQLIERY